MEEVKYFPLFIEYRDYDKREIQEKDTRYQFFGISGVR